jgi:leucyl-tRNA synthetase
MKGFNVLHPMGYDAFGLPAEQYAIETGVHPAVTTKENIENMHRQLKLFGFSYDWDREMATSTPDYYKYTQWIFLQMYSSWYDQQCNWTDHTGYKVHGRARPISELVALLGQGTLAVNDAFDIVRNPRSEPHRKWSELTELEQAKVLDRQRLAYIDQVPVNWCPALGTVLANEEVTNEGRSDRGNHPVFRRPLKQWMLRITRYTDRLLAELDLLDWPEPIKLMQRNWIGKSTGADADFPIASGGFDAPLVGDYDAWRQRRETGGFPAVPEDFVIRVYTTRPDTLFGATYMVLAPEHPLVERITTDEQRARVQTYVEVARHRSDLDRTADTKEKTGEFTGGYAVNPVNGARIPIWVADYVLMGYGTGAIMAVPAHDERDFEFAKAFDLPIVAVVQPTEAWFEQQAAHKAIDRHYIANQYVALDLPPEDPRTPDPPAYAARLQAAIQQAYTQNPGVLLEAFTGEGAALNSGEFDGLSTAEFKPRITSWLEQSGIGRGAVNYKLRDWIFTRQRYWGEPFPILHAPDGRTRALPEDELPLELPEIEDYTPTVHEDEQSMPEPPLGRAADWKTVDIDGVAYARDLNTMPQWAGSCWYYLRFIDPQNAERFCDPESERYWMPVDTYVGGAEHAVLHLLYARFWHKVLYDLGHASGPEPFMKLINQGMIQSFAYTDRRGVNVPIDEVVEREDGKFYQRDSGEELTQAVAKMSKALKNVVSPDEIIAEFGADTFRCYEMFMGPLEASKPWNTRDVPGVFRLLNKIWRLVVDQNTGEISPALCDDPPDKATLRILHKTIKKVSEDIEQFKFNTAIGQIFEFVNALTPMSKRPREVLDPFVLIVSPFAPHLAEELWSRLGHAESLAYQPWPTWDEALARDEEVEIAVQILGKVRSKITMPADADDASLESAALADERIRQLIEGKTVRKVIVVKGRLVNIVAN